MSTGDERLTKKEYLVLIVKSVLYLLVMMAVVFICAGRLSYWQGWVFFGFVGLYVVFSFFHLSRMPGLVRERMRPGPGTKRWDSVLLALYGMLSMGLMVFSALDAGRLGLSGGLPAWSYVAGWLVFFCSYGFVSWAMSVNRWFSVVVRIQADRGQRVVDGGPYRIVRHPGYLGGIGGFIAMPVVLGSLWGLVGTVLLIVILVVRTSLEDRMLVRELPGYSEYAKKVPWRLVPGVW